MNNRSLLKFTNLYYGLVKRALHPELMEMQKNLFDFLDQKLIILFKPNVSIINDKNQITVKRHPLLTQEDAEEFREELKKFLQKLNTYYKAEMDLEGLFASEHFQSNLIAMKPLECGRAMFFCVHDSVHEILRPGTVKTFDRPEGAGAYTAQELYNEDMAVTFSQPNANTAGLYRLVKEVLEEKIYVNNAELLKDQIRNLDDESTPQDIERASKYFKDNIAKIINDVEKDLTDKIKDTDDPKIKKFINQLCSSMRREGIEDIIPSNISSLHPYDAADVLDRFVIKLREKFLDKAMEIRNSIFTGFTSRNLGSRRVRISEEDKKLINKLKEAYDQLSVAGISSSWLKPGAILINRDQISKLFLDCESAISNDKLKNIKWKNLFDALKFNLDNVKSSPSLMEIIDQGEMMMLTNKKSPVSPEATEGMVTDKQATIIKLFYRKVQEMLDKLIKKYRIVE